METITKLVQTLIEDDPKKYGSDKGTARLFSTVLDILEKEERDATTLLTTVERIRRKFLELNPRYDYRITDKKHKRA